MAQVRFSAVAAQQVLGALKATGSTDPDVLAAAKEELASTYRPLEWMGLWAIVCGVLMTALILTAFIGIPLFFLGIFWRRRGSRNLRTLDEAFAQHLSEIGRRTATVQPPLSTRAVLSTGVAVLAFALAVSAVNVSAQQPGNACAADPHCTQVLPFVARVTDFRLSAAGANRSVALTVRFENRTQKPLILGYVQNSAIVTDDQGKRFMQVPGAVRGIGEITGNSFDAKFTLQPGEVGDARFEVAWRPSIRNEIYGTAFDAELSVREILPAPGNQFRFGREYALQFRSFGPGTGNLAERTGAVAAGAPTTPAPAQGTVAVAAGDADACAGAKGCYDAGTFVAKVKGFSESDLSGRHRVARTNIRITNNSTAPIILAYVSGSNLVTDDLGNKYAYGRPGTHDGSATGIPITTSNSASSQFTLRAGETRDISLSAIWFNAGRTTRGTSFVHEFTLQQFELLPSNQLRVLRDYAVSLRDLATAGGPAAAIGAPTGNAVGKAVGGLLGKLRKPQ